MTSQPEYTADLLVRLMARHRLENPAVATAVGRDRGTVTRWRTGAALPDPQQVQALVAFFAGRGSSTNPEQWRVRMPGAERDRRQAEALREKLRRLGAVEDDRRD